MSIDLTAAEYARLTHLTRKGAEVTELVDAARLFLTIVASGSTDSGVASDAAAVRAEINDRLRAVTEQAVADRVAAAEPAP